MRLFLSYRTQDRELAEHPYRALLRRRPSLEILFDHEKMAVGDVWTGRLAWISTEGDCPNKRSSWRGY